MKLTQIKNKFIHHELKQKLHWLGYYTMVASLLSLFIGFRFLKWMNMEDIETLSFTVLTYISHFISLSLVLAIPLWILAFFIPRYILVSLTVFVSSLSLALLVGDTFIYDQFRFHLSGFIIELAIGAGLSIFGLTWVTWLYMILFQFLIVGLCTWISVRIFKWSPRRWLSRGFWSVYIIAFLISNSWHIWADGPSNSKITAIGLHLPFYSGLTAKRFLMNQGWVNHQLIRQNKEIQIKQDSSSNKSLNYPKELFTCRKPQPKYNILFIVIDTLRADMMDPRWMPNTHAFSKKALYFNQHRSNGNVTKSGLFTLFYGIPASYWDSFTSSNTPPVFINRLQELNYQTTILASATLVSPAFDKNIFSSIKGLRLEAPKELSWEKDEHITNDWLKFTKEYKKQKSPSPFFGFLFYDSPHDTFLPKDYPRFEPFWENPSHLFLHNDFDPEPYLNVYRTTVHYTDSLVKKVLDDLKTKNLLKNTIVVMTSDHGQEFNEHKLNYWGHGGNFSDYQLKVPLLIHWPGKRPKIITKKTQHFDVIPTLMTEVLGCPESAIPLYSSGLNLFKNSTSKWSIAHSYTSYGVLYEDLILDQPLAGPARLMKRDLKKVEKLLLPRDIIHELFKELSKFYKYE